jgi:AcrR family transcriptional regulator
MIQAKNYFNCNIGGINMKNTKIKNTTKQSIMKAFLSLLQNNSYDNISIKLICNHAQIHNTTFYDYYRNKLDLTETLFIEYFIKDFIDLNLFKEKCKINVNDLIRFYSNHSMQILKRIDNHLKLIEKIFEDKNLKDIFIHSIKSYISNNLIKELNICDCDIKLDFLSQFIADFHLFIINKKLSYKNITIKDLEKNIKSFSFDKAFL